MPQGHDPGAVSGKAGSWTQVAGADFGNNSESITIRASSGKGAALYVLIDSPDSPVAAVLEIPEGGAVTEVSAPLSLSGEHDVRFVFGGEADFISWQVR